ncbi:sensor histidine kinase [Larkinella sp.]|uniref:sensor histidine kinase n=1 Tax=Larkinella sp. TaxID=2034517 RepID=UPI003BAB2417
MESQAFNPLQSLIDLSAYLAARREAVLNNWQTACQTDPTFNTTAKLSREEFNNKVPAMINVFERRLRQQPLEGDVELLAEEHGLHRWQKGYVLHELLGEVQHLNWILLEEHRQYWLLNPIAFPEAIVQSYEHLAWFTTLCMKGSIEQYTELQRIAASSRAQTLEKTLAKLNKLMRQRGDLLRTTSHDLRGSFGVIQGSASFLELMDVDESERKELVAMLNRNLTTVRNMVVQLMDLARLEAGQEPVVIKAFNAGELLHSFVTCYQPLAQEKGLVLKADGPTELLVESDPIQVQRIVQNLVLNALKHTESGWVSVSWSHEDQYHWMISIQDSGPGLSYQQANAAAQLLSPDLESTASTGLVNPPADARKVTAVQTSKAELGEGIGLSIVKKLCELLGASLEIETRAGWGTLFRIRLPVCSKP